MTVSESEALYVRGQEGSTRIDTFLDWWQRRRGTVFSDYHQAWRWSVDHLDVFWRDIADYFDLFDVDDTTPVLSEPTMPGARWFPGVSLNFAELALRRGNQDDVAIMHASEGVPFSEISVGSLRGQVAALAATLRHVGVRPGDTVAGFVPNIPAAIVSMLASAAIGAVWTQCSPDYGVDSVVDRLAQTDPVVLVAADGYRYGGSLHDRAEAALAVAEGLPGLRATVWIDYVAPGVAPDGTIPWLEATSGEHELIFEDVPFDHPLWVVFSSGTTGVPKGIVHSHGGVAIEQVKVLGLHGDLGPGDRFFYFTSTAWMLWNMVASSLLLGATAVVYDGSPTHPDLGHQWRLVEESGATSFGTGASLLNALASRDLDPVSGLQLDRLGFVGATGAPLTAAATQWFYRTLPSHVLLSSSSGGTDVVTGFVGGSPNLPVLAGELSGPYLGVAVAVWDEEGHPVIGEEGELVITKPMPSMPIHFVADEDGSRLHEAYFDTYPGVWRHGDRATETAHHTFVISGRSDATLNRHGVRMGTADVYAAVESLSAVADCVMVGLEQPEGGYWMPLFVALEEGTTLDADLRRTISERIAAGASPRHVPDDIIQVPSVPRTRTGKRIEVPLKRILLGHDATRVLKPDTLLDPASVLPFVALARERSAHSSTN
ncbi:acetoacetate--CoA ligase [Streptomyces sp. Tu102]|uniref:acetoacetate--CoA ligase n=1 Tax=Streptomyces TaxID=1883 RepID=UPI001BDCCB7C|nr:acetoacetate--CoA ligase [Streptomyces sp. Tu102]MBT1098061.1 acetoacetate--CoA ligase [Streptomyces sp. Tu102]